MILSLWEINHFSQLRWKIYLHGLSSLTIQLFLLLLLGKVLHESGSALRSFFYGTEWIRKLRICYYRQILIKQCSHQVMLVMWPMWFSLNALRSDGRIPLFFLILLHKVFHDRLLQSFQATLLRRRVSSTTRSPDNGLEPSSDLPETTELFW